MENGNNDSENEQKRVAYYQTFLGAWIENRMEADKQILTLSSVAIGWLMTFYDKLDGCLELALWLVAGTVFSVAVIIVLFIFRDNSKYIECVIREHDSALHDRLEKKLHGMTVCAFILFFSGVALSFILSVTKAILHLNNEGLGNGAI
jgi:ABC-type Fe3+-siderophore transport system permease subunit